ncbi:MAG: stage III sporulation protein AC [Clostridia bacterium]|nr:stage III sporulation protein AC [Clostridia bacterium]
MELELILKIAGIGVIVSVLCQILSRSGRDEQATLVSIGGIVIVLLILVEKIAELIRALAEVFGL